MANNCIKVLIVEDSPIAAKLLEYIINSDPTLKVIGTVESGEAALEFIKTEHPDVITMDIVLPKMDGFEATKRIMETTPIPILIVSANFKSEDIDKSFKAMSVGALEILEKPVGPRDPSFKSMAETLIRSIKNASKIKLLTRRYYFHQESQELEKASVKNLIVPTDIQAIAIGASMGGPKALHTIFSQLPAQFPIPILVVQHISSGFAQGLVDWLSQDSALTIKIADNREIPKLGHIYFAPDNFHLEASSHHTIHLDDSPPENGLRPSVGKLFFSMARAYGSKGLGIILTGMGHDGAKELLMMKEAGAMTIAQDQESSLIFGMPKEAIAIGAIKYVLSLQQIIDFLKSIAQAVK